VPFGFRKSFRIVPGVKLNVGKRSAGLSAGPRGLKLSANSRGRRQASASWHGLFWRKRL
jgi:uncharacterized protein DUF4236